MTDELKKNSNCMTVVVGKNASGTGKVLLAHNEDDYVHARVKHFTVPAADWPEGTLLPAEKGKCAIPQVRHTYAYYWIEVGGPEGGLSTSDCFLNENGVCVVSDSSCGSHEEADDPKCCEDGIVYELRRAVAERAESARHAMEIACAMLNEYGYASGGRIYFFADENEAYMLQVVRGHRYVGCKIPDDAVAVMPNHYTIHGLSGLENAAYPADLIQHAVDKKWYIPEKDDLSDFDFAKAYQAPDTWLHPENTLRQKYATQRLLGREWDTETEGYPPYVRAAHPIGVKELMDVMSFHYEGTPDDVRFGAGASPHDTAVRRICTGTTVEAFICEFTENSRLTTMWTAFGRPCQQIFIPLHPLNGLPENLIEDMDSGEAARRHFERKPYETWYDDTYWQAFQDFQNLYEFRYAGRIEDIRRMKDEAFAHYMQAEEKLRAEDDAGAAPARDEEALAYAFNGINDFLNRDADGGRCDVLSAVIRRRDSVSRASVRFRMNGEPAEETLTFGPGRTQTQFDYALPVRGGLQKLGDGEWRMNLVFGKQPLKADGEGNYEFFFAGRTVQGDSFSDWTTVALDASGNGEM